MRRKMETRKRKPLSDLTNSFNLISTSTLRKLVASKTPNSILKSNPSSKTEKLCFDSDTKSGTSIGSSNVSAARNSHTVQFSTDPCRSLSSIASPGDEKTKNGASSRRQKTYGPQKKREVVAATFSSSPLLKMKDKGKAITVPSYCPPPEKTEDYGNPIHGSCSPLEKEMEKVKGNLSPNGYIDKVEVGKEIPSHSSCSFENGEKGKTILNTSGCSIEKTKELRMGILNPSNCSHDRRKERGVVICRHKSSLYKTKEIGKTILNPSSSSVEKTKDKGKAVLNASGCSIEKTKWLILNPFSSSYEERKERGVVIHSPSSSSLEKTKEIRKTILYPSGWAEKTNDKGKTVLNPFGCSIEKTEEKGKSVLNSFCSSLEATKKRGKAILFPSSGEKIKDKGASATEPVNYTSWRRKSGKRTIDIVASSCPPLLKTK